MCSRDHMQNLYVNVCDIDNPAISFDDLGLLILFIAMYVQDIFLVHTNNAIVSEVLFL